MVTILLCAAVVLRQNDVADVKLQDRVIAGDRMKRYLFIDAGKGDPSDKRNLLLILPGGDGSVNFHSFCQRIAKFGLPDNFVVAELVAPVWAPNQAAQVVWPTAGLPWQGMKFTTEDFMRAVISDVQKKAPIGKVYALGWSSGGPPVYASAFEKASPLDGAFIAMSIGPKSYPSSLDGKRFFILHSPQDKVVDISYAENAVDSLRRAGASVKMITYPGGHGWMANVYGNIGTGIQFLEGG